VSGFLGQGLVNSFLRGDDTTGRLTSQPFTVERRFIRYAAYVSFFPQLVAGPIERAGHLLPQLRHPAKFSPDELAQGLSLFVVGLFK
jgi:D-alanyl-lipoteichoic acid acyltransferase DltB (MBOAT superfamily)